MHKTEAVEAVVASIQPLRPTWDARGIRAQITKNPGRDLRDLWIELGIAALTPDAKTPAAIEIPGPWKDYTRKTGTTAKNVDINHPKCIDHPEQPAGRCRICYPAAGCNRHPRGYQPGCEQCDTTADRIAERNTTTARAGAEAARAALRAAKKGNAA